MIMTYQLAPAEVAGISFIFNKCHKNLTLISMSYFEDKIGKSRARKLAFDI